MSAEDIAAIVERLRELLAQATPGPWDTYGPNDDGVVGVYQRGKRPAISYMDWHDERSRIDAELIAAAVNALPALLDALTQAETREKALREGLADVAVWLEAEADFPRPDPRPAMRMQAQQARALLAPAEGGQS